MIGWGTARAVAMPAMREIELHLQEGFRGETVAIRLDGAPVAELVARTRMQLGLAHVERLQVRAGQTLALAIPAARLEASLVLDADSPVVTANLVGGALRLAYPQAPPRYA
jgi:antitoxin (DNA-binding transcriptional repressor) of toxin-antitoxin stability system